MNRSLRFALCLSLALALLFGACGKMPAPAEGTAAAETETTAAATEPATTEAIAPSTAPNRESDPQTSESGIQPPETTLRTKSDPSDVYDAAGFVDLTAVIPDVILEIRYYSTYNFVGERIPGYEEPVALLTREAAEALASVSDEFREMGYRLKIFDAYRPQSAVEFFAEWAQDPDDTRMKEYFYPEIDKKTLFPSGFITYHSGHSRGCTVDLTLFDMKTGKELDMGGPFDYFGQLSHPEYRGITDAQYQNRMLLRRTMVNHGFRPSRTEWWDFSFLAEPYPNTYFSFPVSLRSLGTGR